MTAVGRSACGGRVARRSKLRCGPAVEAAGSGAPAWLRRATARAPGHGPGPNRLRPSGSARPGPPSCDPVRSIRGTRHLRRVRVRAPTVSARPLGRPTPARGRPRPRSRSAPPPRPTRRPRAGATAPAPAPNRRRRVQPRAAGAQRRAQVQPPGTSAGQRPGTRPGDWRTGSSASHGSRRGAVRDDLQVNAVKCHDVLLDGEQFERPRPRGGAQRAHGARGHAAAPRTPRRAPAGCAAAPPARCRR